MEDVDLLIRRVRAGETEVFAEIIRRFEQPVWRVVAAMLQRFEESREIMQQVFVDAYRNLHQYQLGRDFGVWIKAIARNCVRKELRRLSRESRRLSVYREHLEFRLRGTAEADRHEEEYLDALERCRKELPERSATALDHRYVEGKPFEQIARILKTTSTAVEKLLSRARTMLRDCIEKRLSEA